MKTSHSILIAFLLLFSSALFAGNDRDCMPVCCESASISAISLMPVTPREASFDEFAEDTMALTCLAPSTPAAASFDEDSANPVSVVILSPVTPAEADFNDTLPINSIVLSDLAPASPAFADFN